VDYHFVDERTFLRKIERGDLLEWADVHGHLYGTPRGPAERVLAAGGVIVFDIDVQGGRSIQRIYPEALLVFVLPPSLRELERRLRSRGTDGAATIRRRMLAARAEIEQGLARHPRGGALPPGPRAPGRSAAGPPAQAARRARHPHRPPEAPASQAEGQAVRPPAV
jgi:guanylate kinase